MEQTRAWQLTRWYQKTVHVIGWISTVCFVISFVVALGTSGQGQAQQQQQTAAQAQQDLVTVSGKYQSLYGLCEEKYQTAANGDYSQAVRINGQMDVLLQEINQITGKYQGSATLQ